MMKNAYRPAIREIDVGADGPPRRWTALRHDFPALTDAYDALSEACRHSGPLEDSTVALVKLAVSVGAHAERTVHAHAKKALRSGETPEALRQVAVVALPTIGLPAALDALGWIDDSIREETDDESR